MCSGCHKKQKVSFTTFDKSIIIAQTNIERNKRGLPTVHANLFLMKAAEIQAQNMAKLNQLSHELRVRNLSTLEDRIRYVEYKNWTGIAENIAWNYDNDAVVTGWMNSTGHRRNILGNYNEIGVAVIVNKNGEPYYCQVFGKRDK